MEGKLLSTSAIEAKVEVVEKLESAYFVTADSVLEEVTFGSVARSTVLTTSRGGGSGGGKRAYQPTMMAPERTTASKVFLSIKNKLIL